MLGEGSETEREGSGVLGGGNWGSGGREVGAKGEGSRDWIPPVHPHLFGYYRNADMKNKKKSIKVPEPFIM